MGCGLLCDDPSKLELSIRALLTLHKDCRQPLGLPSAPDGNPSGAMPYDIEFVLRLFEFPVTAQLHQAFGGRFGARTFSGLGTIFYLSAYHVTKWVQHRVGAKPPAVLKTKAPLQRRQ
jgi:hypothetical protein